jgi:hypothetical protein
MINSTLSDRLRRMESDLAVAASRAKVETVVGILEAGGQGIASGASGSAPLWVVHGFWRWQSEFPLVRLDQPS